MHIIALIIIIQLIMWGTFLMESDPKTKLSKSGNSFRSKGHAIAWLILCFIPLLPIIIFVVRKLREL